MKSQTAQYPEIHFIIIIQNLKINFKAIKMIRNSHQIQTVGR